MAGHIRRRGGRSWEIKFDVGVNLTTGKREIRYQSVKGTRKDAQAKLSELLGESARGILVDATKETVSQFLDRWFAWAAGNVSAKTHERHGQVILHQVKPSLGAIPIQKLKAVHLVEFYARLLQTGGVDGAPLAASTVGLVHKLLRSALGHAVTWGIIAQNPATLVHPPRVASKEIAIIREDEIKIVLDAMRDRNRLLYTIATVALATGVRRGELLALRWMDVDLDAGRLRVERSLEQTKGNLKFKSPKTKHSRRTISIPTMVVAELHAHWAVQQETRLAEGLGRCPPDGLVFSEQDGSPRKPNSLSDAWLVATAAIGHRVGLHALRHTHASALIAAGIDVLAISRRLGHASAALTLNVYGHLFGNVDDRVDGAVEALFERMA